MIHVNRNGSDAVKIEAKDEIVLQAIRDSLKELTALRWADGKSSIFITKYSIQDLYSVVLKTKSIADWQITGSLIDQMKPLMPKPSTPCDWIMENLIKTNELKLRPYQIVGANSIAKSSGKFFILNDEAGLDRYTQSLLGALHIKKNKQLNSIAVLCPKYSVETWKLKGEKFKDLNLEVVTMDKMQVAVTSDILIIDDVHLMLGSTKRKKFFKTSIQHCKKIINLSGTNFFEKVTLFEELLKMIGINIPSRIVEELVAVSLENLVNSVSELAGIYLKRTKTEAGFVREDSCVFFPMQDKLEVLTVREVFRLDFTIERMEELLAKYSLLKVGEVISYISHARRANPSLRIMVLSRHPQVLAELKVKVPDSKIGLSDKLVNLVITDEITEEIEADLIIIMDHFLETTLNMELSSKIVSGIIVRPLFKNGLDELAYKHTRFASKKRNFTEIFKNVPNYLHQS
jgi:ATP:corrinoid adenosyltransferase